MVESTLPTHSCPFAVNEHVDCLDTVNKWCNAEIEQIDEENGRVFVHYTGFSKKYDEWINYTVSKGEKMRIIKQWRRPSVF